MKKFLFLLFFVFLISSSNNTAFAQSVLGSSDRNLNIPPTIDGPGIFLPDSRLFFLDEIKQKIRLVLALTPQEKATVYKKIAGERMAEIRFMIARNNLSATRFGLIAMSDNFKNAADQLEVAKLSGNDISLLSKEINDDIKQRVSVIDELQMQSSGEMSALLRATSEGLMEAKVKTQNYLNDADLENEVAADLDRATQLDLYDARQSSADLRVSLDILQKQASEAAKRSLSRREAVLRKAIKEKNEILIKEQEKLLTNEKEQNQKLLKLQKRTVEEVEAAKQKIEEAVKKFEELRRKSSN